MVIVGLVLAAILLAFTLNKRTKGSSLITPAIATETPPPPDLIPPGSYPQGIAAMTYDTNPLNSSNVVGSGIKPAGTPVPNSTDGYGNTGQPSPATSVTPLFYPQS